MLGAGEVASQGELQFRRDMKAWCTQANSVGMPTNCEHFHPHAVASRGGGRRTWDEGARRSATCYFVLGLKPSGGPRGSRATYTSEWQRSCARAMPDGKRGREELRSARSRPVNGTQILREKGQPSEEGGTTCACSRHLGRVLCGSGEERPVSRGVIGKHQGIVTSIA